VLVAYIRQAASADKIGVPTPIPADAFRRVAQILIDRVMQVAPEEVASLSAIIRKRESEWSTWEPRMWSTGSVTEDGALLRQAGAYVDPALAIRTWATPTSLRNVDAECEAAISALYVDTGRFDV
jgi:hypothetical protein